MRGFFSGSYQNHFFFYCKTQKQQSKAIISLSALKRISIKLRAHKWLIFFLLQLYCIFPHFFCSITNTKKKKTLHDVLVTYLWNWLCESKCMYIKLIEWSFITNNKIFLSTQMAIANFHVFYFFLSQSRRTQWNEIKCAILLCAFMAQQHQHYL